MNGGGDTHPTGAAPPPPSPAKYQIEPHSPHRPPKIPRISGEHDGQAKEEEREIEVDEEEDGGVVVVESHNMHPSPGLQRYLIAIEYIGTRFFGSQQQPDHRTVVGVLQEAFRKVIGQPVYVFCSSRTDAGVHALSNACHVDVERISKRKPGEVLPPHEPSVIKRAVNHFLQRDDPDVMITDVRCVPLDFHSRYKAKERTYYYRFLCGPDPVSVFEKDRAWHVPEELNLEAMQEACKVLAGTHDFSSFRASGCQAKSPVRTLDELRVSESVTASHFPSPVWTEHTSFAGDKASITCDGKNTESLASISNGSNLPFGLRKVHRCLVVTSRSRSFLYHQVRLIVGALKCVGIGEMTISDVQRILDARTVSVAKPMAPSCGLHLGHVRFDVD